MRGSFFSIAVLLALTCMAFAQSPKADAFTPLQFLIGDWVGEGGGQPGQASSGGTSFAYDVQKHVIVRKNFAEYPATKEHAGFRHDDLMVIFEEAAAVNATYWDNEGHVIHYEVSAPKDGQVVFLSEPGPGPRFRLTYSQISDREHTVLFEMAAPGSEKFSPYTTSKALRK